MINAIYELDALFVVSHEFEELQALLNTGRSDNKSFHNFESRFQVQLFRFNALGSDFSQIDAFAALYLLNNLYFLNN